MMNSESDWAKGAQQFQQLLGDSWGKALQSFQGLDLGAAPGALQTPSISFSPAKLQELQQQYLKDAAALWNQSLQATPPTGDRRFAAEAWGSNPVAAFTAAAYLLNARTLMRWPTPWRRRQDQGAHPLRGAAVDDASRPATSWRSTPRRSEGARHQGREHRQGPAAAVGRHAQGHVSRPTRACSRSAATSPPPPARGVRERAVPAHRVQAADGQGARAAVAVVPPCINKYYILDLQPDNSLIRYAVAQGHRTFVVSWRNPDESLRPLETWDDYMERAAIKAIRVVQDICGHRARSTAGLLRRRHHPGHGAGGAGRPGRATGPPA
jgi:polyhydroxyalkanoate synthase